jgi:hypothetical protein
MKRNVLSKALVVAVIILFVGVGVQPVFAIKHKECFYEEKHDVAIELCGLGKEYAVQLTEQQLTEIDELFDTIRDDLDNVKTMEETLRIYNDAIIELDSYGLFGDCSVKEIQKLIIGTFLKSSNNHVLRKFYENKQSSDENVFCLMCGHTDETSFVPAISMLLLKLCSIIESDELLFVAIMMVVLRGLIAEGPLYFHLNNPIALGCGIVFGGWGWSVHPASGWVHTLGLFGVKSWAGEFIGQIYDTGDIFQTGGGFIGATGFTGIKIVKRPLDDFEYYYLGFANRVDLVTVQP